MTGAQVERSPSWRLGTTSFIQAAGWLDNARWLATRVDDVELLCFEADGLPSERELRGLRALQEPNDLSYTVHTPLSARLASRDEGARARGITEVRSVIAHMDVLQPYAYVVHVYFGESEHDPNPPTDHDAWRERARSSLLAILDSGVDAHQLCVESLDYDYALIEPVVGALGLSAALDLGHLHRDGQNCSQLLARNLPRTRIVQWHGTDPTGRDHRSLAYLPWITRRAVLDALMQGGYAGVLTLEVFSEEDFATSQQVLSEDLRRMGCAAPSTGSGEPA